MKEINYEHVEHIIHAVGVMQLVAALQMDAESKKKTDQLTTMAAVVLTMHNGNDVLHDMVHEEAEALSKIITELDLEEDEE